jgi:hypothetical protein
MSHCRWRGERHAVYCFFHYFQQIQVPPFSWEEAIVVPTWRLATWICMSETESCSNCQKVSVLLQMKRGHFVSVSQYSGQWHEPLHHTLAFWWQ